MWTRLRPSDGERQASPAGPHAGYLVTLAEDVRDEDAEEIMTALRMVCGVLSVDPIPADTAQWIGQQRADVAWRERLLAMLKGSYGED